MYVSPVRVCRAIHWQAIRGARIRYSLYVGVYVHTHTSKNFRFILAVFEQYRTICGIYAGDCSCLILLLFFSVVMDVLAGGQRGRT